MSNPPQYRHVVDLIERLGPVWQERMGLTHVEIAHVFLDTEEGPSGDDFRTTAVCETRWQYAQAKIKWYLPSAVRHDDRALEGILVHELCHVLLAPEQSLIDIKLEQVARDVGGDEIDPLVNQFYERLEMSTEATARALVKAWKRRR